MADPDCQDADGNMITTDQRGVARPQDRDADTFSFCDIGAFEVIGNVEDLAATAAEIIGSVNNLPGANGMISKLTDAAQQVSDAVSAFDAQVIDLNTYLAELQTALETLNAFDNQLAAKINNGQIVEPQASQLLGASAAMHTAINALIANAGS